MSPTPIPSFDFFPSESEVLEARKFTYDPTNGTMCHVEPWKVKQ